MVVHLMQLRKMVPPQVLSMRLSAALSTLSTPVVAALSIAQAQRYARTTRRRVAAISTCGTGTSFCLHVRGWVTNFWNRCCPSGHTCAWLSDSVVGCCPPGCSCSNTNRINTAAAVVTQTLAAVQQPTVTYIGQTTVIVGAGGAHWGGPPSGPPNGPPNGPPPGAHFDGYCSTLYANGPNLPTTAAGPCGTILVLNTGVMVRPWVEGRRALAFFLALALGGLGWLA